MIRLLSEKIRPRAPPADRGQRVRGGIDSDELREKQRWQISGYGDPLERDAAQVLDDVLDGLISAETAERENRVVIAGGDTLDEAATEAARAARRA